MAGGANRDRVNVGEGLGGADVDWEAIAGSPRTGSYCWPNCPLCERRGTLGAQQTLDPPPDGLSDKRGLIVSC